LFFEVLMENEPDNLLINQAYKEVFDQQLEELRLRQTLHRMQTIQVVVKRTDVPSPFAFPILVDRMREQLSSEKLEDRIEKMMNQFKKKYGTVVE
jgi:ATP-dependent helicase Lhr and Lhr-like helicase